MCVRAADGTTSYKVVNSPKSVTFSADAGATYFCMVQRLNGGGEATLWPMLAEGGDSQPYVPYAGGAPVNLVPGFSDLASFNSVDARFSVGADGWGVLDVAATASQLWPSLDPLALAEPPESATLLLEWRACAGFDRFVVSDDNGGNRVCQFLPAGTFSAKNPTEGSALVALRPSGKDSPKSLFYSFLGLPPNTAGHAELRVSVYAGAYDVGYLPWRPS